MAKIDDDNVSKMNNMKIVEEEEDDELVSDLPVADGGVEQETPLEDPHPLGNLIRVCGRGEERMEHYEAFAYDGNLFSLEDTVLLAPEEPNQKPGMAIIKAIAETPDQKVIVTGQMFYRPEEAQRSNCGYWKSRFKRELFYSFHREEFPAESVMHKFVVHYIPQNKQIPPRKQHPGFIVQKIYDTKLKRLYNLTSKDYGERRWKEIDLLVQKTKSRLGDLPDICPEEAVADQENPHDQLVHRP